MMAQASIDQDTIRRNLELFLEYPPFPLTPKIVCEVLREPNFLRPVWRRVLEVHGDDYLLSELRNSLEIYYENSDKRLDNGRQRSICGVLLRKLKQSSHKRYIFRKIHK